MPVWLTRIWAIAGCAAIVAMAGGCGGYSRTSADALGQRRRPRRRGDPPAARAASAARIPRSRSTLRATPDAADQRHQLYVQWLNARVERSRRPAARRRLDAGVRGRRVDCRPRSVSTRRSTSSSPRPSRPIAGTARSTPCRGSSTSACCTGAPIWCRAPPRDLAELVAAGADAPQAEHGVPFGLVWQGARYEGLVTVFLEHLGAFGGAILDDRRARRRRFGRGRARR